MEYQEAFNIIIHAGNSESNFMLAIEAARNGNFEEAQNLLEIAEKDLLEAHSLQLDLMKKEANNQIIEMNIMLVHAQDHLTSSTILKNQAEEFLQLYQVIDGLKKDVAQLKYEEEAP